MPSPLSDHNVTILIRYINGLRQKPRLINFRNYANYNPTSFQDDLMNASWDEVNSLLDVNVARLAWKNIFINLCDKHAPPITRKVRGRNCPWISSKYKSLMRESDYFLKKARQINSQLLVRK